MAENYYDQFQKWKNTGNGAGIGNTGAGKTGNETSISDAYEEAQESQESGGAIEQVSRDLFGFTEAGESNDEHEEHDNVIDKTDGAPKTSFSELRLGKKVPRLKKTMVLALIAGGTFVFLFIINLILQKKEEERQYFEGQKNNIAVGNDFSINDLLRRSHAAEDEPAQTVESAEFYFRTPPLYEPIPAFRQTPASAGMGTGAGNVPPANTSGGLYSESDLMAMKARIGKEGGYGFVAQPAGYDANVQPGMGNPFPTREEYTRQKIEELGLLTQALGVNGQTGADRANNGRFSDAGNYNPHNAQAGTNINYFDDNCLFPGTIIHAILISRIDTDYPGPIHARVTENVYDSLSGKNLLIPQGTILQGNYSSSSIGVAKVQVAWESMVVNYDGIAYQVSLGGMAGVDKRGRAGIAGTLDDHYFEWLKAAGIISLFSIFNSEVSYQMQNQTNPQARELMEINQGIVNQLGDRLIERALNIQPSVKVANGTSVSVAVNAPITLRPFPAIRAEEKYIRR